MTEYMLGKRSAFAYALESTYGTANAASAWSNAGMAEKYNDNDEQDIQPLIGMNDVDTRIIDEYYAMVPKFSCTVEGKLQHMRFPMLGIGSDVMNPNGTHTFNVGTLKSFDMQVKLIHSVNPFIRQYTGCKMGKVELSCGKGDWLKYICEITAQKLTKVATFKGYGSGVLSKRYTTAQMRPYLGSDMTTTINGVNISPYVTQVRVSIDNDMLVDAAMDLAIGKYVAEPAEQVAKVTGGLTVKMKDADIFDLFLSGNDIPNCSFKWTRGTDSLTISFNAVKIQKAGVPVDIGSGVISQDLNLLMSSLTIVEVNGITTNYNVVES